MCIDRGWGQGGEKREAAKVGSCECERRNMGSSRETRNRVRRQPLLGAGLGEKY